MPLPALCGVYRVIVCARIVIRKASISCRASLRGRVPVSALPVYQPLFRD